MSAYAQQDATDSAATAVVEERRLDGRAGGAPDLGPLSRWVADRPAELPPAERAELIARAEALAPWLQGPFPLGSALAIPGAWHSDVRWAHLAEVLGDGIRARRVLDVGSSAGYDAFALKAHGAGEVLACEPYEFHHQALFLESIYRSGVELRNVGWQRLDPVTDGSFDLIHCHGVLYHEPNPMLLLQKLRALLADDGQLLLGSVMLGAADRSDCLRFVPDSYGGDPTWWFVPGRLALRWMLEVSGFEVEELPVGGGPPGEFHTVSGYMRCRPADPAPELDDSALRDSSGSRRRART